MRDYTLVAWCALGSRSLNIAVYEVRADRARAVSSVSSCVHPSYERFAARVADYAQWFGISLG